MSTITFDFRHHYQRGERRESEQIAYQWDLGHVMEVFVPEDATYTIGYCFGDYEKTEDYAIDTKVQDPDGGYKLTAHIPNKYFERSGELRVYVVGSADDHIITTYEGFITIRGRLMPDDYVDDDPENGATQIIEVAREYATKSESFAVGGTGTRLGEDTDNAKYYKEQAEEVAESIPEDYSELSDDVDQLKNALTAVEIVDSASGTIASFADGSDSLPVKGLTVQLEPIQAGSGDPSPTNIRPISGRTAVTVTRTGFNVWDEEWELGGINSSTGVPEGTTDTIRSKNFCSCMPSTAYYGFDGSESSGVAVYIWYYDAEKSFISGAGISNLTFTTPSNARYFKLSTYGGGYTTYKSDISINYPSTDHDYHAGHVQTVEIPLGQTVYGGTLDVTTGVLTVDKAIKTFDGSESWETNGTNLSGVYRMALFNSMSDCKNPIDNNTNIGFICNLYISRTANETFLRNEGISLQNGAKYIAVYDDRYNTSDSANDYKTYLSNNPLQLVYPLAAPQTYQLTPQQVTTLLGYNNVWSDADSVSVDYVADTKLYIEQLTEPDADMVADMNITSGKYFMVGNTLYLATANIANGAAITVGVNCTRTSLAEALNAINS